VTRTEGAGDEKPLTSRIEARSVVPQQRSMQLGLERRPERDNIDVMVGTTER
jgi:hypothetical protein